MSRSKQDLHSELVQAFDYTVKKYTELYPSDPVPFLTYTHRSDSEQNSLYEIGRTKPGKIVTNAKAGQSPHNYNPSFAFDIAFITVDKKVTWNAKYFKMFADCIKSDVVSWGGAWTSFKDAPHFELKNWKTYIKK